MEQGKRLYRSRTNRVVGGVCGGLGDFFGIDPTLLRVAFALLILAGGFGFVAYLVLWIIIPEPDQANVPLEERARTAAQEIQGAAEKAGHVFRGDGTSSGKVWVGILLVAIGVMAFGHTLWPWSIFRWSILWPVLVIALGASIIFKRK